MELTEEKGIEVVLEANPNKRVELATAYRHRLNNIRLTPRNKLALRLWGMGVSKDEICTKVEIHPGSFDMLRVSPVGKAYLALVTMENEERFKMLFGKVVNYIDKGLDSADYNVKDRAAKLWAGMSGRLVHTVNVKRTAEDNVKDLLEGKVIEIEPDSIQESNRVSLPDPE